VELSKYYRKEQRDVKVNVLQEITAGTSLGERMYHQGRAAKLPYNNEFIVSKQVQVEVQVEFLLFLWG
jgi:hypothetical protein